MPRPGYRSTLRRRLTLFYAALFFASGTAVLLVPLLSIKDVMHVGPVGSAGDVSAVAQHDTDIRSLLFSSVFGLVVMAVLSVVFGWLLAGRLLRPLRTITATARDISASNLSRRLSLGRRDDEFAELGETLNDLFGRLEAAFDSQRHFVANASHELRTPLTAERALLQVALSDPDAPAAQLRAACTQALALGKQQEQLIDALLTLASSERGIEQPEPFDLAALAGPVIAARTGAAQRAQIQVSSALAAAPAMGDPSLAESLISNLVDNALRHNVAGGQVDIRTAQVAGRATISVRNTGPLIPSGEVDRLFQPFQRLGTDRTSRASGHGLGLAITAAIAHAHQATLTARARPAGGLDITLSFPPPAADRPDQRSALYGYAECDLDGRHSDGEDVFGMLEGPVTGGLQPLQGLRPITLCCCLLRGRDRGDLGIVFPAIQRFQLRVELVQLVRQSGEINLAGMLLPGFREIHVTGCDIAAGFNSGELIAGCEVALDIASLDAFDNVATSDIACGVTTMLVSHGDVSLMRRFSREFKHLGVEPSNLLLQRVDPLEESLLV